MANKKQVIKLSKKLKQKIEQKVGLTPKEQCQVNHSGQCGACSDDGYFTPCG